MAWEAGSVPYARTFRQIAERTGVSVEWLRDGIGDEESELAKVRISHESPLKGQESPDSSVREDPHEMPFFPQSSPYSLLEKSAARMPSEGIAATIIDVLNDRAHPQQARNAAAQRLAETLRKKLAAEAGEKAQKN